MSSESRATHSLHECNMIASNRDLEPPTEGSGSGILYQSSVVMISTVREIIKGLPRGWAGLSLNSQLQAFLCSEAARRPRKGFSRTGISLPTRT